MPEKGHTPSILLLAVSETAAALDRRALREAGYPNARFASSGITAAKYLGRKNRVSGAFDPDVVVCQQQLQDMDAEQFCAIIRQHPGLKNLPILLILPNDQEAAQARAMGSSASLLLGRPYSVDILKQRMDSLYKKGELYRRERESSLDADCTAFEDAIATSGVLLRQEYEPEDYFKAGLRFLEESRWPLAIQAFEHASQDSAIKAETSLGLAAAYKGKGDLGRARDALIEATETFVAEKRWDRARTTYARLLQHDPSARNPFLTEAHRLIRAKDYGNAAETLAQCLSLLPKIKAAERLARICLSAEDPQEMYKSLEAQLDTSKTYSFLANQVKENLAQMEQQREERLIAQAQERKWQLAQAIKNREAKEAEEKLSAADRQLKLANAIKALNHTSEIKPMPVWDQENWAGEPEDDEEEISSIGSKGFFGELISMIRLTWQLDKKSRKNH